MHLITKQPTQFFCQIIISLQVMHKLSLLIFLTLTPFILALPPITASLSIVQYEPMVMQLSFSESVAKPQFQLIFNNFQTVPYQLLNQVDSASNYYIQIPTITNQISNLQIYTLIFNSPLSVGEGRLDLSSYSIEADKSAIKTDISKAYAIFVLLMGYLLSNFTLLGNIIIEYSQFYVLLMFKSKLSTTLFYDLSLGLLLIPPVNAFPAYPNLKRFIFQCLTLPLFIIFFFGTVGFILKRCIPRQASIKLNIVLDIFTYSTFVNICFIFSLNLLFNSAQFISIATNSQLYFTQFERIIGYVLVYFSILTLLSIAYLQIYVLNPKIKQNPQSWQKYLGKWQFLAFSKLHEGINTTFWYTRNSCLFILLKKVLIVAVFFTGIFEYLLIYLQFALLYYLFTIRPYKEDLYMNIYFIARLLAFVVYGTIVLGDIYFSLGEATFNYSSAKYFIVVRDILFLIIVLVILGVIVRQIYQKISNFNYRIRLVREENEFKLQILEKNAASGAFEVKKTEEMEMAKMESHVSSHHSAKAEPAAKSKKSFKDIERTQSSMLTVNLKRSLKKRKSHANLEDVESNIYKDFQISAKKQKQGGKEPRSENKVTKWKEESLLEEMMKMK